MNNAITQCIIDHFYSKLCWEDMLAYVVTKERAPLLGLSYAMTYGLEAFTQTSLSGTENIVVSKFTTFGVEKTTDYHDNHLSEYNLLSLVAVYQQLSIQKRLSSPYFVSGWLN